MGAEIKIYQSLWKNLLLVICCMLFAIGAIFIIADDNCKIITKICGGWLGVMFFGVGGLFICVTTFYNSMLLNIRQNIFHKKWNLQRRLILLKNLWYLICN